jgi:hypothetical protein
MITPRTTRPVSTIAGPLLTVDTTMDTGTASLTLLNLPGELQNKIIGELEPLDLLILRATCRHFRTIIPLDIHVLVAAETSTVAMERNVYACCLCLRLRHSSHFADKMMKKAKRKLGGGGPNRFCTPCGLNPPPGRTGYGRGTFIMKNGVVSVLCICCGRLEHPAQHSNSNNAQYCVSCWARTPEGQEMQRQEEAERERREKVRAEAERRRREMNLANPTCSRVMLNPRQVATVMGPREGKRGGGYGGIDTRGELSLETHVDGDDWRRGDMYYDTDSSMSSLCG